MANLLQTIILYLILYSWNDDVQDWDSFVKEVKTAFSNKNMVVLRLKDLSIDQ